MYYNNHDAKPATTGEKVLTLGIGLLFLALLGMEIMTDYEPKKLSALLFILFWPPLLLIHELGHALMAKLLGWKVQRIVLGVGKVFTRWRWFNAPVEVRAFPLEGFVQIAPRTLHGARYKHALIYFAGPGIELLLFVLIAIYLGGFEAFFTITNDYTRIALQSFAFAGLVGAVLNLIPQGIITKDGTTPNDGMGILLCLFAANTDYENWIQETQKAEQSQADEANAQEEQKDEAIF
ncbi:MAG: hypothetical protein CSA51_03910 [Gammaproteobacteria bacterium]|nr:MAG: hypothetical protein CSA51_03910 [Gammaproteobacteria bacterium]